MKLGLMCVMCDERNRIAAIRNSGPVSTQWYVRFLNALAKHPTAIASKQVAAEDACSGCQNIPMIAKTAHATSDTTSQ